MLAFVSGFEALEELFSSGVAGVCSASGDDNLFWRVLAGELSGLAADKREEGAWRDCIKTKAKQNSKITASGGPSRKRCELFTRPEP